MRTVSGETPPSVTGAALQVWLFGGSLVWGTGVNDDQTLAAVLQREFQRELGRPVQVHNFGESGYVSQQSQLAFAGALRCAGPPPQLALFLDGANDVYAALQAGRAGLPQNEQNRAIEFNLSRRFDRVLLAWAARLKGVAKLQPRPDANIDPAILGAEIARNYLATVQQIQALAAARQLPTLLFWQPTLFDKTQRSSDEQLLHGASLAVHAHCSKRPALDWTGQCRDLERSLRGTEPAALFRFCPSECCGYRRTGNGRCCRRPWRSCVPLRPMLMRRNRVACTERPVASP